MKWLSYADRELLLRTLDAVGENWSGSDEDLLAQSSEWAKSLSPTFGFEHILTRDITSLSKYLIVHREDPDISGIARGGLLYLLQPTLKGDSPLGQFGLIDDAFVLAYAVHEIRTRLGETATYSSPGLTSYEKRRAEDMFLDMIDRPGADDEELIKGAEQILESFKGLSASGFFRRLNNNVIFLRRVLYDNQRSEEHRNFARAALAYIVAQEDAIDDRLGIVGYLDDNFIAQTAVDLIEPQREPLLELIDATVAAWPFMAGLVLDENSQVRPLSEYNIINAAICCRELRTDSDSSQTILVVPSTGPLPLMLGFFSALGAIQRSGNRHIDESSFQEGQTVIVDNSAIAEFAGFKSFDGRRMFGLRQYYKKAGRELPSIRYWPISGLRRLVPSSTGRRPQGQIEYELSQSNASLPGLEYVFASGKTAELSTVDRQVIVVMPLVQAKELCVQIRLYGFPLKEIIPIGQLTAAGTTERWSEKFGQQEPLLIFVPDIDAACAYAEKKVERIELVVVDASRNRMAKPAGLQRLKQYDIPSVCVTTERLVSQLSVDYATNGLWEWSDSDIASLVWPTFAATTCGTVASYEERIKCSTGATPIIHRVFCDATQPAYQAVRSLTNLAHLREDDRLSELDNAIMVAHRVLSYLLRASVELAVDLESVKQLQKDLIALDQVPKSTRYLSQDEAGAVKMAAALLSDLLIALKAGNPKASQLLKILSTSSNYPIICPDARIRRDLNRQKIQASPLAESLLTLSSGSTGAIVPGWFGKERMSSILFPAIASPLHLILYDLEATWYHSMQHERTSARSARALSSRRSRLFPGVLGWGSVSSTMAISSPYRTGVAPVQLDPVEDYVRQAFRRKVQHAAAAVSGEDICDAKFATFEGGVFAFLTHYYKANVVTHLIESSHFDSTNSADVLQKSIDKLSPGDALLFHRGSQRDAIRIAADSILRSGCRETSSLWRTALLRYSKKNNLSIEDIYCQLQAKGCELQQNTIRGWFYNDEMIAPLAYKRDVPIIAEVTKDSALADKLSEVLTSIAEVRSAHLKSSRRLAAKVKARAVQLLKDGQDLQQLIELEENVVIATLIAIDDQSTSVRKSEVNRLLEDEVCLP